LKNAWLALGTCALILASCSSGASSRRPDLEGDQAAVRTAVEAYLKGMLPPGDVAGMLSPFADSAHYLVAGEPTSALARQSDGAWRIIYHMYNSDHPTPPTVTAK
jgi:hypothetical protein